MTEIRLCWRPDIVHHEDTLRFSQEWLEATPKNRRAVELVLNVALDVYGPGSHWIEERDAAPGEA